MAKEQKQKKNGPVEQVRAPRQKSAKQLAQIERNKADHAARMVALQAMQTLYNEVRAQHPGQTLSDQMCQDIIDERAAREELQLFLACDMLVGGEAAGARLMRFIGPKRLKEIAQGKCGVRHLRAAIRTYMRTQHEMLLPVEA